MNVCIFIETTSCFHTGVKGRSRVERRMFGGFLYVPMWRPCLIKDLRLCYQSPSALSRPREEQEGWTEEELQRQEDGEVLSTSLPNNTIPHRRLWLLLSSLSLCLTSPPVILSFLLLKAFHSVQIFFCLEEGRGRHVSPLSLNNSTSWSYNNISLIHQGQPALINKHFESTPQHHTEVKMSPLCLCQYLSPCWQSYIRLRGYYNRFHNAFVCVLWMWLCGSMAAACVFTF